MLNYERLDFIWEDLRFGSYSMNDFLLCIGREREIGEEKTDDVYGTKKLFMIKPTTGEVLNISFSARL